MTTIIIDPAILRGIPFSVVRVESSTKYEVLAQHDLLKWARRYLKSLKRGDEGARWMIVNANGEVVEEG